ncbi:cation-translocating P-type ATPase [Ferrovibrio sp.]|uniref:cation-translocating P-type ATPase n=1 Tax=Ferrovibrio sp. TaxID=1917215 RepID=UPI003514D8B5
MSLPDRAPSAPPAASPFHALPAAAVLAALDSHADGLDAAEVAARLQRHGPNRLPEAQARSLAGILLGQFRSPFIYLLLAAAAASLLLGHHADAGFIGIVLLLNAAIGGWQEWGAETRARALRALVRGRIDVCRAGRMSNIDTESLVPGDIVRLESGLKVPADLRLIEAERLEVDESLLTGESLAVTKDAQAVLDADAPLGDRVTMLHAGTLVQSGRGLAVVAATGRHSEVGRLALAMRATESPPPLVRRMAQFTRQVAVLTLLLIAGIAALQLLRGDALGEVFLLAVALAVSAIPEGLPVAMTVALSISVHRMGLKNVVVRHLPAVEGLGACTLIATDKTGTLTVNRLAVETVWLPGPGIVAPQNRAAAALALAAARCSEGHAAPGDAPPDHAGEETGDAVDLAFLRMAARFDYDAVLDAAGHRGRIAYEPALRYAADFHADGDSLIAYVKGAPETVLALCGEQEREEAEAAVRDLAAGGYRVIAVAAGPVTEPEAQSLDGLILLGLAGLIDPLRDEAAGAVRAAQDAGIRVVMVTGDHPLTALAIARQVGIADSKTGGGLADTDTDTDTDADAEVVTGAQLRALEAAGDTAAFDAAVAGARVFARTEPLQKLAIVQALGRAGHVVAVTGDGINDAAALRAADIGVAMGRGGTDVAREAADLILVDDNFASIVAGIAEGRTAYDNLRKVIWLVISTGTAEIILMLLAVLSGLAPPLTAVQLLWINLVTNGIQDVALAFEKAEPGVLHRRPRQKHAPVFDRRMIEQVLLSGAVIGTLCFAGYVWAQEILGLGHVAAQGFTLWLLVWCENMQVMACRSESRSAFRVSPLANPLLIGGVIAAQGLQFAASQLPGIGPLLQLHDVDWQHGLMMALPALLPVAVSEAWKLWRGKDGSLPR